MSRTFAWSRVALAGLLCSLGALALTVAPARAAEPGVVPDLTWYISDADKQRTADALEEMGSQWVRLHVQWREAEPQRGQLNEWWMSEYGKAIEIARNAGQRVVVMVSEAPTWASGSASSNVPADPQDFADFMGRFAERFEGQVDGYEIWNEPNIKRFWKTGPNAAEYTALLQASATSIRAADPNAKVVFAGLSTNDYSFLNQAYQAGAKGYFDVLATHPYTYCGSTGPADTRYTGSGKMTPDSFLAYRELRAVMVNRNDPKPIWFTEFGWNTSTVSCSPGAGQWQGGVSESKQAQFLTEALELIEQDPYVQVAMWYGLRNNYWANDANEPEARFGLLRTDYSRKPAFYAFASYATGEDPPPGAQPPAPVQTETTLKVKKPRKGKPKARGGVAGADRGTVRLRVQRKVGKRWKLVATLKGRVNPRGRYSKALRVPKARGLLRVAARYTGTDRHRPSRSPFRRLRLR